MPVELQANALLSLEEGRAYLGVGASEDEVVKALINRMSDYAEGPNGANRPLVERAFTALRLEAQRTPRLRTRAVPIKTAATLTVSLDGTALTVWKEEADGDPNDFDVVVGGDGAGVPTFLERACGWHGCSPFPILLAYTGGWPQASLPGDLKEAAELMLLDAWRRRSGAGSSGSDIQSFTAGPVSPGVTFREDRIPMKAREILNAHRWRQL